MLQYIPGSSFFKRSSGSSMVSWCYCVDPPPRPPVQAVSLVSLDFGGFLRYWFFLGWRWRRVGGGRGWLQAGSSPSRMVFRCPGGGKVNLLFEPSLHLGDAEGERAAQREGGLRLAGRAGLRKQESSGGATGERGRSCQTTRSCQRERRATRTLQVVGT